MKKILLMMVLLGVYAGSVLGQDFKLVGPQKGSIGSQSEYVVYFLKKPTKIYQLSIKVTGGAPVKSSIGTSIGIYNYSFKVNWSQITNNAKVEVSLREAISNKPLGPEASISKIVITKEPVNPAYDTSITGPDKLYVLETARYDFKIQNNKGSLSWRNLLEEVLYIKPSNPILDERYRMVTALAPPASSDAGLVCTATELNVELGMAYKVVKIIKPQITTSTNIVCANQNITFTLKDHYPSATINWQVTNMTLVSGQGTANAVFKATGNGYANVKAILTYGGRSYTVENSSVWVGIPGRPTAITGFGNVHGLYQNASYDITTIGGKGIEEYHWKIHGNATPTTMYGMTLTPKDNRYFVKTGMVGRLAQSSSFGVVCTVKNKCGNNTISIDGTILKDLGGDDEEIPRLE